MKTQDPVYKNPHNKRPSHNADDIVIPIGSNRAMRLIAFLGFDESGNEAWQNAIAPSNYPCGSSLFKPALPCIPSGQDTGDLFQLQTEDFRLVSENAKETSFQHGFMTCQACGESHSKQSACPWCLSEENPNLNW